MLYSLTNALLLYLAIGLYVLLFMIADERKEGNPPEQWDNGEYWLVILVPIGWPLLIPFVIHDVLIPWLVKER